LIPEGTFPGENGLGVKITTQFHAVPRRGMLQQQYFHFYISSKCSAQLFAHRNIFLLHNKFQLPILLARVFQSQCSTLIIADSYL
jgi:hypothetical protein